VQFFVTAGAQVPEPSQAWPAVETSPPHDAFTPHAEPAPAKWHMAVSAPSHLPVHVEPSPGHAGCPAIVGSPVMGTHAPLFAPRLQDSQSPAHASLQHTPSKQYPELQAVPDEQGAAFGCLTTHFEVVVSQYADNVIEQSESVAHVVLHCVFAALHA
jgi:hypothetical protein